MTMNSHNGSKKRSFKTPLKRPFKRTLKKPLKRPLTRLWPFHSKQTKMQVDSDPDEISYFRFSQLWQPGYARDPIVVAPRLHLVTDRWVIHGLLLITVVNGVEQEEQQFCPCVEYYNDRKYYCSKKLEQLMPTLQTNSKDHHFRKRQFKKHGSCLIKSGNSRKFKNIEEYMCKMTYLAETYDIYKILKNSEITPGDWYIMTEVDNAINKRIGKRTYIRCFIKCREGCVGRCEHDDHDMIPYLTEICVYFDSNWEPVHCDDFVLTQHKRDSFDYIYFSNNDSRWIYYPKGYETPKRVPTSI